MRKFSKGDKVRFTGDKKDFNDDVTNGGVYVINEIDWDGDAIFNGDRGDSNFISKRTEHLFELVDEGKPVEASPTVIELLANISRRLYEAEQTIKSQAYEINELYKADAERAVADRG